MQRKTILKSVISALDTLFEEDRALFEVRIGERALAHRLASYLRERLLDWNVDCEYDRRHMDIKRLPRDGLERRIVPDIIVHRRQTDKNLLAIEIKKLGNRADARDHWKLQGLTAPDGQYRYKCALYMVIDCATRTVSRASVYDNGDLNQELTAWLRDNLAR
jgi:hypothetical protein